MRFRSGWLSEMNDGVGTVNGVIHQSGGLANFFGGSYYRGSAVSASFPWLYQTGGTARVFGLPIVTGSSGTEQLRMRWSDGTTTTYPAHANPQVLAANATDLASAITLVNQLKTAMLSAGLAR